MNTNLCDSASLTGCSTLAHPPADTPQKGSPGGAGCPSSAWSGGGGEGAIYRTVMYIVQCILYSVHYTVYSIHLLIYSVWYRVQYILYYSVHYCIQIHCKCTVYNVQYTAYIINYKVFTVYCTEQCISLSCRLYLWKEALIHSQRFSSVQRRQCTGVRYIKKVKCIVKC